jgi:hypothetical protein
MQPMQPPVTYAQRDALRRDGCSDQLRSGHHPELGCHPLIVAGIVLHGTAQV